MKARKKGITPFLTATSENNGVSNYIDESIIRMKKKENTITIDMFYNVFYHGYPFLCDDNVHILTLKKSNILNKNIGLFLVECLKSNKDKYHYGLQLRIKHLSKETVKLPSKRNKETSEYEPDWKYMEAYISKLEDSICLGN